MADTTATEKKPTIVVKSVGYYPRHLAWLERKVTKLNGLGIEMDRSKLIRSLIDKEIEAERSAEKKGGK